MPRYDIRAEFDLATEVEPDISHGQWDGSGITEEFSDESYFQTEGITISGGSLQLVIEADSEEAAEEALRSDVIYDGQEVEDSNGLTWAVENLSVEVEEVVPPLTVETAKLLVATWLGEQDIPAEVKEALQYLLARVA